MRLAGVVGARATGAALVSLSACFILLGALVGLREVIGSQEGGGWSERRSEMVEEQIRARGVSDLEVLRAMASVPRHLFVPETLQGRSYEDYPLPLEHDQTISQPYIVAFMTELLELEGDEKVLEIGTGSGYQAAVLGEIAAEIYSIEIVEPLATSARKRLAELGYRNIEVRAGDGYAGWPEEAPFDAIILTAAPPAIPQPLIDQLAIGGRLIAPVGRSDQELVLLQKTANGVERRKSIPVRFVPMTGTAQEKR